MLEKIPESPWDSRNIKPVHLKGNQPWIFIGRTDADTEAPVLWPPDLKSQLTGKDLDAGKDWGQEKGMTEAEMVGWHHWLNRHELTLSKLREIVKDREAWPAACSPWVRKSQTWFNYWTTTTVLKSAKYLELGGTEQRAKLMGSRVLET